MCRRIRWHAQFPSSDDRIDRPCGGAEQQWWTTNDGSWEHKLAPLFQDFERVYDAGQFTWAGLWTVSDPPGFAHAQLVDSWEMVPGPVTRWALPSSPDARVFEIHRPQDWVQLVQAHPRQASTNGECWELPSRNQDVDGIKHLLTVPGQHAARDQIRTHLVPDWRSVAGQYDGVHVSWAGLISAEGFVSDLGHGDVPMLPYWFSERTHWLNDVFGEPVSLGASHPAPVSDDVSDETLLPPDRESRRLRDRAILDALLNRPTV